jgi:putative peptide zinc metalloprotease protein
MARSIFSPSWHNVAELRPRLLAHARFHRHVYRSQPWHVVHDPTGGKYHRLSPGAYALVRRMDGQQTVQALWDQACRVGGDDTPTQNEIVDLLVQLHAHDLLYCDVTPDAAQLFERFRKQRRSRWKQRFGNPLGLRFPLIDPDAFLTRWSPLLGRAFALPGAIVWLAVVLPALVLAGLHWSELTGNLSDRLLSAQNLALLTLLYIPIKALHELAHGAATKRWGGAVPEMGVMLLVFAPVPYVDSSASSAFRARHQRAIVGAAGMLVETFIAALAMYTWLLLEPGTARAAAFNVMLVAGVSTLVVNGNPLLRFDGYYILCDLIDIPNLGQRGQRYCTHLADRYLFRARALEEPDESLAEKRWLAAYTVLSWLYRLAITVSIMLFIAGQFFIFGVLLALWALFQFLGMPLYKTIKHIRTSPALARIRPRAARITIAIAGAVVSIAVFLPMPLRTQTEGVVWLPDNALLRAGVDGTLREWLVKPGQFVTRGTPLAMMDDPALDKELEAARANVAEYQARYDAQAFTEPAGAEVVRQQLEQRKSRLRHAEERHAQLIVASESDGTLVAPQYVDMTGQFYRKGELLGYILDRHKLIARIAVPQMDIDLVRTRLRHAQLRLADSVSDVYPVSALREVPGAVEELPSPALSPAGGGKIPVDPKDPHGLKLLERVFLFDLDLPDYVRPDRFGAHVYVRFEHLSEPLAHQWYRRLRQLFLSRFDV